jgi:hypothetical protein
MPTGGRDHVIMDGQPSPHRRLLQVARQFVPSESLKQSCARPWVGVYANPLKRIDPAHIFDNRSCRAAGEIIAKGFCEPD